MRCDRKSTMSEDEAECTRKLGSEPPKPEFDGFEIGDDLAKRLQTGVVDEERNANYDNYWREKLACMDHTHTDRYRLTVEEAEMSIENIQHYLRVTKPKNAKIPVDKLAGCIEAFRGRELRCSSDVQDFINSVDSLAFKAVRTDSEIPKSNKKTTYAERFQRNS